MAKPEQIEVENVNTPGQTSRLNAAKYNAMRECLLSVLPKGAPGVTQKEMLAAVKTKAPAEHWPNGEKSAWWAKAVQLDLEAKGLVQREMNQKPLRWHVP